MGMGYVGRNSETELSLRQGLKNLLDAPRPPSTVISFEWLVLAVGVRSQTYGRVQDSELRRSVFFFLMWRKCMLRLPCVRVGFGREQDARELPCTEPEQMVSGGCCLRAVIAFKEF
jgi:hypothetical protein